MIRNASLGPLRWRKRERPRPVVRLGAFPPRKILQLQLACALTLVGQTLVSGHRHGVRQIPAPASGTKPPDHGRQPVAQFLNSDFSAGSQVPFKLPSLLKRRLAQIGNSYLLRPPVSLVANAGYVPVRLQPGQGLPHRLRLHPDFGGELGLRQGPFTVQDFQRDDPRVGQPQGGELFIPSMLDQSRGS